MGYCTCSYVAMFSDTVTLDLWLTQLNILLFFYLKFNCVYVCMYVRTYSSKDTYVYFELPFGLNLYLLYKMSFPLCNC